MNERHVNINAAVAEAWAQALSPDAWTSASFAEAWYRSAQREARDPRDQSKAREILFAVCFAESYIFEWALGIVGVEAIGTYFPPRHHRRLKEKWRSILKELYQDGRIRVRPSLDLSEFGRLIKFRNGLVHASASRPMMDSLPSHAKPSPSLKELRDTPHSWAVGVVANLVRELHKGLGTEPPDYFTSS